MPGTPAALGIDTVITKSPSARTSGLSCEGPHKSRQQLDTEFFRELRCCHWTCALDLKDDCAGWRSTSNRRDSEFLGSLCLVVIGGNVHCDLGPVNTSCSYCVGCHLRSPVSQGNA